MQQDVLRAKWKQFRTEIQDRWAHLSRDDLDQIDGRPDCLAVLLERRYGYARRRAEREVERIVTEFVDKLRKTS